MAECAHEGVYVFLTHGHKQKLTWFETMKEAMDFVNANLDGITRIRIENETNCKQLQELELKMKPIVKKIREDGKNKKGIDFAI